MDKKPESYTGSICFRTATVLFLNVFLFLSFVSPAYSFNEDDFYKSWRSQLSKFVSSEGTVNYKGWKKSRSGLDKFISSLSNVSPTTYKKLTRNEKMALWINAYNAITIKQILDNYPIKRTGLNFFPTNSIRQIGGVWDKKKIVMVGRSVSLGDIENKILRKEFKDPLIHFAINCASKSCPRLLQKPYLGKTLPKQLHYSANRFIMDKSRNKFDSKNNKVELSSIFQWYRRDFVQPKGKPLLSGRSKEESGIIAFLRKYASGNALTLLQTNNFRVSYLRYDWSLNEG